MKTFRDVLRVIATLATVVYFMIFVDEAFPPYEPDMRESDFGIFMVFVLFIWYLIGYYYVWKNEWRAGLIFISWWIGLFLTALLIWMYGNVTVILGLPVPVIGALFMIYYQRSGARSGDGKTSE